MWFYAFIVSVCIDGYCDDTWVDWNLTWDDCTWLYETYYGEGTPSCVRDYWEEE